MDTTQQHVPHLGHNFKRLMEILGYKQEAVAADLGVSQARISKLTTSQFIEDETLANIAKVLKVPVSAIINFKDSELPEIIAHSFTFNDNSQSVLTHIYHNHTVTGLEHIQQIYDVVIKQKNEHIEMLTNLLRDYTNR